MNFSLSLSIFKRTLWFPHRNLYINKLMFFFIFILFSFTLDWFSLNNLCRNLLNEQRSWRGLTNMITLIHVLVREELLKKNWIMNSFHSCYFVQIRPFFLFYQLQLHSNMPIFLFLVAATLFKIGSFSHFHSCNFV